MMFGEVFGGGNRLWLGLVEHMYDLWYVVEEFFVAVPARRGLTFTGL